ncbi:MAG: OB-fold nucleic acid binding domain-containing protein [Paludibacteraceae bacterium]|nr:OB-fold nucleic acid binding domain-containing protein [Paludibacteraceae bacterium]
MKKIFLFCAALMAAVSMQAELKTLTCAQAKAYATDSLQSGETAADSVIVVGYVTVTNGQISQGQQRFNMDDEKGTGTTFLAYFGNMPEGEKPLNPGDKVAVYGKIQNYNGEAQMKNPDVTILERIAIQIDTLETSICDAIEACEQLNANETTTDYVDLTGEVKSTPSVNTQYGNATFELVCDKNEKVLKAYNIIFADGNYPTIGDEVNIIGKLTKYGTTCEIIGEGVITKSGSVKIDTIPVNVAGAVEAGKKLEKGKTSVAVYVVEGYVDSIAYEFSEEKKNMSFYMGDAADAQTYDFEAYKVSTDVDLPVGTKVWVVGNLYHYYKEASEDGTKPEVDLIEISGGKAYLADPLTGLEDILLESNGVQKFIENGRILILKDGVLYNVLGAQLR